MTFKHLRTGKLLALAAALIVIPSAAVQAEDLPTGDQILADYLKATGGKAAYEKHKNFRMVGLMEMPAMGMKGKFTNVSAAPNSSYTEIEIEGIGKQVHATNGEIAWAIAAMQGPRVLEGAEREETIRSARFNSELHWKDIYKTVECVGIEQVDGQDCYKLVKTTPAGKATTEYYSKKSKLIVKVETVVESAMGDMPMITLPSDYKEVDGVLMPMTLTQKISTMEQRFTFETLEYNVELPADQFAVPEDIKALIEKAKQDTTKKNGN